MLGRFNSASLTRKIKIDVPIGGAKTYRPMKVFVTGGTGAIGRHAVIALIEAGHTVSALSRSAEKADDLRRVGATPLAVSLFDRVALTSAFRGHEAVVNLATALPSMADFPKRSAWTENNRIRGDGAATVVDAALGAEVPLLVQESVSMIYRDGGRRWIDEAWPVDDYPAARSNLAAETNTKRFARAGGTGIVLRFGWFYGPGATHSEQLFRLARHFGLCPLLGDPDGYVSSIHVADAGRAVEAALRICTGVYNVVDDVALTKRAYADAIAAAAGREHYLRFPGRLALIMGDRLTSLTRSLRVSNARLKILSGWAPIYSNAKDGWRAVADSLVKV